MTDVKDDVGNLINPQGSLYDYSKLDTVAGIGSYVGKESGTYTERRDTKQNMMKM